TDYLQQCLYSYIIKSAYYAASISGIFSKQPCCSLEIRLSQKPDLRGGKRAKDMIIKPKT
ncbi:hypothetical protein ACSSQN_023035, partial [Raoultella planticola]|uniref:hypothetical protein n=1 Tax=Raoultella planticola TaxID=575 RepID=UPI003FD76E79